MPLLPQGETHQRIMQNEDRMNRFFVNQDAVGENTIRITNPDDIKHLTKVLRLKIGDEIEISDGKEYEYIGKIASIDSEAVACQIMDKQNFARESRLNVTLFQGIPKQGKMEVIIQKTIEMGIKSIIPVFTARTVVEDKGNFSKKIDRWQKVADEAVKQCKRGMIPQVQNAITFKEMCRDESVNGNAAILSDFDLILFPYENEQNTNIKDILREYAKEDSTILGHKKGTKTVPPPTNIAIIIGPEGGFCDEEAKALVGIGAKSVSLGKTILRTETAGLVALSMVMYELELL